MPTVKISDEAFAYLQSQAEPLVDTVSSVLDRVLEAQKSGKSNGVSEDGVMVFGIDTMPSVKHSTVTMVQVDGHDLAKPDWNHSLVFVIERAIAKGAAPTELKAKMQANCVDGAPSEAEVKKGYRYSPKTAGFTFQGLDAERACKNIMSIAKDYALSTSIGFRWGYDAPSYHAGKSAKLTHP